MFEFPASAYPFEAHVQSKLGKLAKHVSVKMRLRRFCKSSIVMKYYDIYMKPIIQYGLSVYGCTKKSKLKDILLLQKKVLRLISLKNRRHPCDELFERSRIMNVYDLYVCELLKYAVHSTRGKIDKNVESLFTQKSSSIFTRNVSTNMFHVSVRFGSSTTVSEVSWNVTTESPSEEKSFAS